jgi:integrase
MATFRYPNSRVWWFDFQFAGQRIRESTKTRSRKLAKEAERARRRELEESYNGVSRRPRVLLFPAAVEVWMKLKSLTLAPSSLRIERDNLKHLIPHFGKLLLSDIQAHDIRAYQHARISNGASPKTVNLEVGTLRAILRRNGLWARVQLDVRMLPTRDECGHALTEVEEVALLKACLNSRSRSLYPAVVLALSTGMRYSEIRLLRWSQIKFEAGTVTVGKSKTTTGTGRTIPLNAGASGTLRMWASQFPARQPDQFLFPSERYGASGDAFEACAYDTDPSKPLSSWKVAWEAAKRRAGAALEGKSLGDKSARPLRVRFHDLRHTACTRMLEGGVPYPVVASIMGWSASTSIRMAKRYGHIGQSAQREAVGLLGGFKMDAESFEKSPDLTSVVPAKPQ